MAKEVKRVRIISLVPSWTETLIAAGHTPVGRTRYCLHPSPEVDSIPIVGGTKNVDWDKIRSLKPDLLILDKEENPFEFSQQGIPYWASHVKDGQSLSLAFQELSKVLGSSNFLKFHLEMEEVLKAQPLKATPENLPGCLEVLKPWSGDEKFTYVIWRKPWMAVHPETYIGFVLEKLGYKLKVWKPAPPYYPEIDLEVRDDQVYLFSSEPFPFLKQKDELLKLGVKGALVDGECFSWFGIRSLNFLKKALQIPAKK